jgi:hypothetical protein
MADLDPNADWLAGIMAVSTENLESEYQRGYDNGYAAAQAMRDDHLSDDGGN